MVNDDGHYAGFDVYEPEREFELGIEAAAIAMNQRINAGDVVGAVSGGARVIAMYNLKTKDLDDRRRTISDALQNPELTLRERQDYVDLEAECNCLLSDVLAERRSFVRMIQEGVEEAQQIHDLNRGGQAA